MTLPRALAGEGVEGVGGGGEVGGEREGGDVVGGVGKAGEGVRGGGEGGEGVGGERDGGEGVGGGGESQGDGDSVHNVTHLLEDGEDAQVAGARTCRQLQPATITWMFLPGFVKVKKIFVIILLLSLCGYTNL